MNNLKDVLLLLLNLHLEAPCRDELERYYLHSVNQST